MPVPIIQSALNGGEISPELFGRVDLQKYRSGTSTCRNMFASYRGGVISRAGTLFCGICKQGNQGQANSVSPPRNIPFQYSVTQGIVIEGGDNYFRFLSNGAYITEAPKSVTAITNTNPAVLTVNAHGWSNGDEVYLSNLGGIPQLSSQSFLVANATTNTFTLKSALTGASIGASTLSAYTGAGTAARLYTLATPYAASDLPSLKWTQSADVMSLTHPSYPPYDLARVSSADWTLTRTTFQADIVAPATISLSEKDSGISTKSFYYQFVATAVSTTGQESPASPVGTVLAVDISSEAATIAISCAAVTGAASYNFYAGPVAYQEPPSPGGIFGYIGTAFGPSFTDTNVTPDFAQSPPLHANPFATSTVEAVVMTSYGSSYSVTATTATVVSPIGSNPVLQPIVVNGEIVWTAVQTGGEGLTGGEAVTFIDATGAGSGAAATLTIGPSSGTWPGCVSYFQERRFYGNTNNNPDTYFASQPGAFTNMDSSLPVTANDAIIGSPWSQQVNGIQWMLNMPGGLVILTGLGAWQLGAVTYGSAAQAAITPSTQVAVPQAYNGCSPTVPPIIVNYDILYVQEKGSIIRDLSYNFFVNIYTGTDLTVLSNHLFDGHTIVQWGWAEEPYKLIWVIRDDGILLCLTYLKEQEVYAWTRHDTNGIFQSVCTVSEPPVNAPYFVVKRLIQNDGAPVWAYFQERMDNRQWGLLEDAWCVDAGLAYQHNYPDATLTVSSAAGVSTLQQPVLVYGGANYSSATFAEVLDSSGSGAIPSVTIENGVVTAVAVSGTLTGYTNPVFRIIDPTGAGAGAAVNIAVSEVTTVSASAAVFSNAPGAGEAGDVIRMGGRRMLVTAFNGPTTLTANVIRNDAPTIPNDPFNTAPPAASGAWSISAPTATVYGLGHLEGMQVSVLADGVVVAPQTVANGTVTLPQPASAIVVGLGFTVQMQTLYLDVPGAATMQGRRKEIDAVTLRVANSGQPFQVGANQPDASTQPGQVTVPWSNLSPMPQTIVSQSPLQPSDLMTGDLYGQVIDQLGETGGQLAVQQTNPIPLEVLAVVTNFRPGDDPGE